MKYQTSFLEVSASFWESIEFNYSMWYSNNNTTPAFDRSMPKLRRVQ